MVDMAHVLLANLPTLQKKIRVMADWTLDFFFKRDVTMLKSFVEEMEEEEEQKDNYPHANKKT
jgi:hypothetical protein